MHLEEIKERLDLLTAYVLSNDEFFRIALEYGWGYSKIEKIHSIMWNFEQNLDQNFTYADIDMSFKNIGIDYQTIKSLFLIFYRKHMYINTIKRYLQTNHAAFNGQISSEYIPMYNELFNKINK